jgi:hypothetical protein
MLAVSAAFQSAVKGTHVADTKIEAWYGGTRIATTEGDNRLPGLIEGTVTADATQSVRRTYAATFATQGAFPGLSDYSGPFAPYGTIHKVWRGVVYPNGTREWVQLGTFRLDSPGAPLEVGPLKVTGSDLSKQLIDNRLLTPATTGTTVTVPAEIALFIRGGMGGP